MVTCYCNDLYREAAKKRINVTSVEAAVEGDFGGEGEPARNVTYGARVSANATESDILELMKRADAVAEIQNTLRIATPVTLSRIEATSAQHPIICWKMQNTGVYHDQTH